jgi:WD40 repeat protein
MCVSSGFDSIVTLWDLEKNSVIKKTNLNFIAKKQIQGQLICPPLVYNVATRDSTILASTETGHVFAFNYKELNKAKYIIDAHIGKVMMSDWCKFDENIIITISTDLSFALWDVIHRDKEGSPNFMRRIQIPNKPNWIETTQDRKILVGDTSELLYIYSLKG